MCKTCMPFGPLLYSLFPIETPKTARLTDCTPLATATRSRSPAAATTAATRFCLAAPRTCGPKASVARKVKRTGRRIGARARTRTATMAATTATRPVRFSSLASTRHIRTGTMIRRTAMVFVRRARRRAVLERRRMDADPFSFFLVFSLSFRVSKVDSFLRRMTGLSCFPPPFFGEPRRTVLACLFVQRNLPILMSGTVYHWGTGGYVW